MNLDVTNIVKYIVEILLGLISIYVIPWLRQKVQKEKLEKILEAGLLAPSSRNLKPCTFCLVKDRDTLKRLAKAKCMGGGMLSGSNAAVAVLADSSKADTWVEDSSIALSFMMLMAQNEGIGCCWVQIHLRKDAKGRDAEANVRTILSLPEKYRIVGILALGIPEEEPESHTRDDADFGKVRRI